MENCSFNTNISPYLNLDTQDKVVEKCSLHTALQVARTSTGNLERYKDKIIVLNCLKEVFLSSDQLEKENKQSILVGLLRALSKADLKSQAYKVALFFHPLDKWFKVKGEHSHICSSCWLPLFAEFNQAKTLEFIKDTLNNTEKAHDAIELFKVLLPYDPEIAYTYKDRLRQLIQEEGGVMSVEYSVDLASSLMPYFPEDAKEILKLLKSGLFTGLEWLWLVPVMVKCGEILHAQKTVDEAIEELSLKRDPNGHAVHSIIILHALVDFNPKMFGIMVEEVLKSFDSQEELTGMIVQGYALIGHLFKKTDPDRAFKLYEKSRESAFKIENERCACNALAFMARIVAKKNLPEAITMIDSIQFQDIKLQAYVDLALDNIEI